jgi:hypothetical protein
MDNMASLIICGTGVFTLLTISIGEELESRFFKVTSCVSSHLRPNDDLKRLLMIVPSDLGIDGDLRHYVVRSYCRDSAAFFNRQDVFRAVSGYRSVPEKTRRSEDKSQKC